MKIKLLNFIVFAFISTILTAHAELVIVGTRVIESGGNIESDICVFDTSANIKYDITNMIGYEFKAIANGKFLSNPITSQVAVATYNPSGNRSLAKIYTITPTTASWISDTNFVSGYEFTDIASGQFDSDSINEYAVSANTDNGTKCRFLRYKGTNWLSESPKRDGNATAITTGQYDSDPQTEIVFSRYIPNAYEESDIELSDSDGSYIKDSANRLHIKYADIATGDIDNDGIDETLLAGDRYLSTHNESRGRRYQEPPTSGAWNEDADTLGFEGSARKIATGNFDSDPKKEFVIVRVNWFEYKGQTKQETEIRIYDDDMSLLHDSANPWSDVSQFTSLTTADLNNDGIDEIIVGLEQDNGSTIRIYDNSATLLHESRLLPGKFTDITVLDAVPEPTTISLVGLGIVCLFRKK